MTEEEYKSCDNCNNWKDSIYCRKPHKECTGYILWEPIDEEEKARDEFRKLHSKYRVVSPKIEEQTSGKINKTITEGLENEIKNNHKIIKYLKDISELKTEAFNDLLYASDLRVEAYEEKLRQKSDLIENMENCNDKGKHPLLNYNKGTMPEGWGLVRHVPGKIIVTHRDGSGIVLQENSELISESLFYRMMDQILLCK